MKSSLTRITCEALAKMLNLPDGVTIDAAFQDAEDLKSDTVSFRLRGAGDERPEGGQIKYVSPQSISPTVKTSGSLEAICFEIVDRGGRCGVVIDKSQGRN